MKIRTSETSIELTGCTMTQPRALLIYKIAIGVDVGDAVQAFAQEVREVIALKAGGSGG
jgi:hypothetical protein